MKIYVDHNVMVGVTGYPRWADADAELTHLIQLCHNGAQLVLSSQHIFELAKAGEERNVAAYCATVEQLRPEWANNPVAVRREELLRFLAKEQQAAILPDVRPFSPTSAQMWASYKGIGLAFLDDNFTRAVNALRRDRKALDVVRGVARQTMDAIHTNRRSHRDGSMAIRKQEVEIDYFARALGRSHSDPDVLFLAGDVKSARKNCQTIRVEHFLFEIRFKENFTPEEGDASDYQHALCGLPYCDAFVTDDRHFRESCVAIVRRANRKVQVLSRISEIR